ncbi:MAG: hypothetical protein JNN01_07835, partial [Opitutaceae bacterium]|nr:hypothetical protein [Opitutaceae bacterium]
MISGAEPDVAPDLILHGGRIATVDAVFSMRQAVAIRDGRFLKVGNDAEVLALRGARTEVVSLEGAFVVPGLIDSHAHPADACLTEFD